MMKFIIIFLNIFSISISQTFSDLYKSDLNPLIFQDDYFLEYFENEAEDISVLNPELLATLIKNINLRYENNKSLVSYTISKKVILKKRSKWAETKLFSVKNYKNKTNRIEDFYESFIEKKLANEKLNKTDTNIDISYRNYVVYKFLKNDPKIFFSDSKNYNNLRSKVEIELIEQIEHEIKNTIDSKKQQNYEENYSDFVYLFSDSYLESQKNKIKYNLYDLIILDSKKTISYEKDWSYHIIYEAFNRNNQVNTYRDRELKNTATTIQYRNFVRYILDFDIRNLIKLGVSTRFDLKYLNYFELGAQFGFSFNNSKSSTAYVHTDYNTGSFTPLRTGGSNLKSDFDYYNFKLSTTLEAVQINYRLYLFFIISNEYDFYDFELSNHLNETVESDLIIHSSLNLDIAAKQYVMSFADFIFGVKYDYSFDEVNKTELYPYVALDIHF